MKNRSKTQLTGLTRVLLGGSAAAVIVAWTQAYAWQQYSEYKLVLLLLLGLSLGLMIIGGWQLASGRNLDAGWMVAGVLLTATITMMFLAALAWVLFLMFAMSIGAVAR